MTLFIAYVPHGIKTWNYTPISSYEEGKYILDNRLLKYQGSDIGKPSKSEIIEILDKDGFNITFDNSYNSDAYGAKSAFSYVAIPEEKKYHIMPIDEGLFNAPVASIQSVQPLEIGALGGSGIIIAALAWVLLK